MSEYFAKIAWHRGADEAFIDNKYSRGHRWERVTLRPQVTFSGKQPTIEALEKIHHQSHEQCFIANSVKTEVVTEIVFA